VPEISSETEASRAIDRRSFVREDRQFSSWEALFEYKRWAAHDTSSRYVEAEDDPR
jgi:hypothetical protein